MKDINFLKVEFRILKILIYKLSNQMRNFKFFKFLKILKNSLYNFFKD